ncbi:MAG: hypothetical protein IKR56_07965 [Lachnospiraceae bacterium]|nr:hypothetical protein [Lachnospiraceae bacterium]
MKSFTIKLIFVFLCPLLFLTGCSDDFRDTVAILIDPPLWEESTTLSAAPTVEEMIESGSLADEGTDGGIFEMGSEPSDEEVRMSTSGMFRYSYSELNEKERLLYREIYTVLYSHADAVTISSTDADQVDKVFLLVMNDHPEIFYVTGYSMNKYMTDGVTTSLEFTGTYDKDKDEVEEGQKKIDRYVGELLDGMPEYDEDYRKVRYVYEYLIDNTDYDLEAEDNQNILSVFKSGKSVCQGYAKATQYILNELDIPCLLVTGTAKVTSPDGEVLKSLKAGTGSPDLKSGAGKEGEGHAWNIAYVDGEWTNVDTTWGDASYRNIITGEVRNEITYDYLCVGDDVLEKSHKVKSLIDLPEAVTLSRPIL